MDLKLAGRLEFASGAVAMRYEPKNEPLHLGTCIRGATDEEVDRRTKTMHRSRLGGLILDCKTDDLEREARFWSQALGYAVRASADPDEGDFIPLDTPPGQPYIEVQSVDHPSRVHLDIKTDDLDSEVARLERLGARRVEKVDYWWVMEAPSGHRFCVIPLHPGQDVGAMNVWNDEKQVAR